MNQIRLLSGRFRALLPKVFSHTLGGGARRILGVELDPSLRRVAEDYDEGLPLARISKETFWSPSSIRRIARMAGGDIRPPGRPPINRELVLEKFERGVDSGLTPTEAVRFAARMAGCSESTVLRARRGE